MRKIKITSRILVIALSAITTLSVSLTLITGCSKMEESPGYMGTNDGTDRNPFLGVWRQTIVNDSTAPINENPITENPIGNWPDRDSSYKKLIMMEFRFNGMGSMCEYIEGWGDLPSTGFAYSYNTTTLKIEAFSNVIVPAIKYEYRTVQDTLWLESEKTLRLVRVP